MRRSAFAHSKADKRREHKVVLLVADVYERLWDMVKDLGEALHGLGAGSIEAGDVDGEVVLEVGDRDWERMGRVAFGAGVSYTVEEWD
jgi:hypothetical protein